VRRLRLRGVVGLEAPVALLENDHVAEAASARLELAVDLLDVTRVRGPEIRSSSLRCGFVFVDEATEQVSALNVVEIDVGLCPWWRFFGRRSLVQ
jgi:hypothetical protein